MPDAPPRLSDLVQATDSRAPGDLPDDRDPRVLVLGDPTLAETPAFDGPSSRRVFLARASTLSLAIPGLGAALAACTPADEGTADSVPARTTGDSGAADAGQTVNANSRLDTALAHDHVNTSSTAAVSQVSAAPFRRYDPTLPPLAAERTLRLRWRAQEVPVRITKDTVVAAWTNEQPYPNPILNTELVRAAVQAARAGTPESAGVALPTLPGACGWSE